MAKKRSFLDPNYFGDDPQDQRYVRPNAATRAALDRPLRISVADEIMRSGRGKPRKLAVKPSVGDYAQTAAEVLQGLRFDRVPRTAMRAGQQIGPAIGSGLSALYDYVSRTSPGEMASSLAGAPAAFGRRVREDPGVLLEMLPGAGTVQGIEEGAQRLAEGDPEAMRNAAALAVFAGAMDLIPGGGKGAGLAVKGAKGLAEGAAREAAGEAADLAVSKAVAAPKVVQRKTRSISAAKAGGQKIPGAPLGVNTAADEARRRKSYSDTMNIGRAGAGWYDDSGEAILSHVGDDAAKARRAAEVFSITSSGTGVPANSGFAVKGINQASFGDPVATGRFPVAMGKQIEDVYGGASGTAVTGLKRTPFADQLAIGGGFYNPGVTGQGHRGVHDIWDGEAWGYTDAQGRPIRDSFNEAQHNWMDRQMQMVLKKYANDPDIRGLPGRGQAATWTGAKIRAGDIMPEDAAYSFAEAIPVNYAQGSREAIPGSNTGHMQGLLDAPFEARRAYTDEFMPIFIDEAGRDRIALNNNMLTGSAFEGPGIYEGVNPGRQVQYAVGTERVPVPGLKGADPIIDEASRGLMFNNEAIFGLLGGQKGIAGNRFYGGLPRARSDAFELDVGGRPISYDEGERTLRTLSQAGFGADDFAIVPSPRGVRAKDLGVYSDDLERMQTEDPEMYARAIAARTDRLNRLSDALGGELGGKSTFGSMDSIYAENAWDRPEGALGQQYLPLIFPEGRPQFVDRFNAVAPDMAQQLRDLDRRFSRDHGLTISSNLDDMRAAIAGGGEAGLRALIRKRGMAAGGLVERDMVNAAGDLGLLAEKYA